MITNNLPQTENLRIPPHSREAEYSVIASIMAYGLEDQRVREAIDMLSPGMFYFQSTRDIFRTIAETKITDSVAVADEMERLNRLGELSFADIVTIGKSSFTIGAVKRYVEIIRERHSQRRVIELCNNAIEQAYSGESADASINQLIEQSGKIDTTAIYKPRYIGDMVSDWLDVMDKRAKNDESVIGVPTGIEGIDNTTVGLGETWLSVLAGRPSHGKSLFAQHMANHIATRGEVLFMSMEMSYGEIMDRVISLMSHCDPSEMRRGTLTEYDYSRVSEFLKQIKQDRYKLHYDDTPSLTIEQICSRAKAFKRNHPNCKLIQIDYLGLMESPNAERNDLSIKKITNRLKQLAKEIRTHVMLLTQLSREADKADRCAMNHLADSASIERDSDLVIFCRNLGVHNPAIPKLKGHWMLSCGKSRHGPQFDDVYIKSDENRLREMSIQEAAMLLEVENNKSRKGGFEL